MGTIKRSPELPPEASGCWSCALGAFHAQRRAAAHLQPIPADTAVKHFSGPSPPLPRAAAERHAATWRQVSRSRHSPGKCPMSSRTSASVFSVITDGILRGRGNGRDQFGRDTRHSSRTQYASKNRYSARKWQTQKSPSDSGNGNYRAEVLSRGRQIVLEKIMTRSARIGLAAALLLSGATFAMAQNGPPTGGYPPARWNPNLYGYHGYYNYYARPHYRHHYYRWRGWR
jgi:hypothetical protein